MECTTYYLSVTLSVVMTGLLLIYFKCIHDNGTLQQIYNGKIQIIKVEDNHIKNVSNHSSQSYLHNVKTPTA